MSLIRVRLVAYAVAVLVCQGAVLSAAPVVLCRGAMSEAADVECSMNLGPGQTCPMHNKSHSSSESRGPAWTCLCSPSNAVLASLVGVSGALPEPVAVSQPLVRLAVIVSVSPSIRDHRQPPQYPPPRA
jgi:hypothetical protein